MEPNDFLKCGNSFEMGDTEDVGDGLGSEKPFGRAKAHFSQGVEFRPAFWGRSSSCKRIYFTIVTDNLWRLSP